MCTFSASWRRFWYNRKCLFSCIYNNQITISPTLLFSANFNGNCVRNHPKPWTCPSIVPLCNLDPSLSLLLRAEAVYQSMKSTFGAQICHLLQINSRSPSMLETMKTGPSPPDPWSQFLPKTSESQVKNESFFGCGCFPVLS